MPKKLSSSSSPSNYKCYRHKTYRELICIEFETIEMMTKYVDIFSTTKEGYIPHRIGHNFEFNYVQTYLKTTVKTQTKEENEIGKYLQGNYGDASYIIAWKKGDIHTFRHEFQHARFAIDSTFRSKIEEIWYKRLSDKQRKTVEEFLTRCGYPKSVHIDEFQAYLLTEKSGFFGIKIELIN